MNSRRPNNPTPTLLQGGAVFVLFDSDRAVRLQYGTAVAAWGQLGAIVEALVALRPEDAKDAADALVYLGDLVVALRFDRDPFGGPWWIAAAVPRRSRFLKCLPRCMRRAAAWWTDQIDAAIEADLAAEERELADLEAYEHELAEAKTVAEGVPPPQHSGDVG